MADLLRLAPYYEDIARGRLMAVNVLGEPFFESGDDVVKVSPETGEAEKVASARNFDPANLDDCWTAAPLKADWENMHGPMRENHCLMPITALVLGGSLDDRNLMCIPVEEAASLYRMLRSELSAVPDGARVRLEVAE